MKVQTLSALATDETGKARVPNAFSTVHAGTEMMDGQLMGEFEAEAKELEADSWSLGVEQQYLQQLDRELVKRQDVIYGTSVADASAAPVTGTWCFPGHTVSRITDSTGLSELSKLSIFFQSVCGELILNARASAFLVFQS